MNAASPLVDLRVLAESELGYLTEVQVAEATPTVSLSTLAKAIGPISPRDLVRLLRGHKYGNGIARRSYENAREQAISLLVDDVELDVDAPLRAHEREVLRAMSRSKPCLPAWVKAVRPTTEDVPWELDGVRISMQPDLVLEGAVDAGAAKFCFAKEPLARGVGSAMASLLWYGQAHLLGRENVKPSHCIVYEPRLPWTHLPGRNPLRQVETAVLACRVISALWQDL